MTRADRGPGRDRLPTRLVLTVGQGVAALVGLALLAAASGILLVSQTSTGRQVAARFLQQTLQGAMDGQVEVGRVVGGNLVTRITLERFRIADGEGRPFLMMRDVRIEYSPLGLLTGDYHLRRMTAGRLELNLHQRPGGEWNFDRIFGGEDGEDPQRPAAGAGEGPADPTGADSDDGGVRLRVTDATVRSGRIEVRTPWEGSVEETTVWRLEKTGTGLERVIALENLQGSFPLLRLSDPVEPMRIETAGLGARVLAVTQPLELDHLDTEVEFGDTVQVELPAVRLAESRFSGSGWVLSGDPPRYRFDLDADRLAFSELRWLPVPVPEEGGGEADLVLRTSEDPEVMAVEIVRGSFRSGGSRVDGGLTLYLEETPRLEDVGLELRPLQLSLYHRLTGGEGLPGRVRGTVSGSGPLDLFRTDAALRIFRPDDAPLPSSVGWETGRSAAGTGGSGPDSDSAAAAPTSGPSRLRLRGGVGLTGEPRALRELEMQFEDFEPGWARLVDVDLRQVGRLDGRATLDRSPGGRVSFEADLSHRSPGAPTSRVEGRGTFQPGDPAAVDVEVQTRPLALSVLDPWFPSLEMLGTVRGPLSLSGTLSDLDASADLETPRGELQFEGNFDLAARRKSYDARLTARDIQLQQWLEAGPRTRLDVTGRVEGRGTDPDSLEALFDLQILPSRVHGARVDSSVLHFTVARGQVSVDTLAIRSDVGNLEGRGGFGLGSGQSGSLLFDLEAPDLATWNRWMVPGRLPVGDTAAADLFAAFPEQRTAEEVEEGTGTVSADTLAGSLTVRGVLHGNVDSFGFGGSLEGRGLRWGRTVADSIRVTADVARVRTLDSLQVEGTGLGLGRGDHVADSASFRLLRSDGGGRNRLWVTASREGSGALGARAELEWTDVRKELHLDSLDLRTESQRLQLADTATVAYGDSGLAVRNLELVGERGGRLRVDGVAPVRGDVDLALAAAGLDAGGIADLIRPGSAVEGTLEGTARLRGTAAAPTLEAEMTVDRPGFDGLEFDTLTTRLDYRDRRLSGRVVLREDGTDLVRLGGDVRVDLALRGVEDRLLADPLDLELALDELPLGLLLLPTGSLREVKGRVGGQVTVQGSTESPRLDGEMRVREGAFTVVPLGVGFRRIDGSIRFRGTEARTDSLKLASSRGGTLTVAGSVDLAEMTDPGFDLELRARKLRAIERRRATLTVAGRGQLEGSYRRLSLTGDFRLSDGTIRVEEFLRQRDVVDLTDPELYGLVDSTALAERSILSRVQNPLLQNLRMEVNVTLGPDLWLRSPDLSVELAGDLDVRMDRERGEVTAYGEVQLVRGDYRFTGARGVIARRLRISEGQIEFVGTPGTNPNLDITAAHTIRPESGTIRVEAHITGTMLNPVLNLTSEPPLSESDQVCVLLLNSPCAAPGAGQLARSQLLGRVGAELSSVLASEVGVDYLELRSGSDEQNGNDESTTGEEGSFLSRAEVEAGWYLSPEVFLTVTYPFGNRFPAGSLDWRFSENWSVELLTELRFDRGLRTGTSSNLERERTWGLFLFSDWSF